MPVSQLLPHTVITDPALNSLTVLFKELRWLYFLVKAVKMNTNWVIVKSDFNFFLPFLVDC